MADTTSTLDPADWGDLRAQAHRMLDDMLDHLEHRRDLPLWQAAPATARAAFRVGLPREGVPLATAYGTFRENVLPYGAGNTHPGFMGWVQGGGTAVGMLAEMLAAGFNANCGGRDHMAHAVERQITAWMAELYGFPSTADGLFLTGASQANFLAVLIARVRALGAAVRQTGTDGARLVAYASEEVHGCVPRAMEMAGIGSDALRLIAADDTGRVDVAAMAARIAADRAAGAQPFLIVGTAGTVNTGAVDDLAALADLAAATGMHFHVDAALGGFARLVPDLAPRLAGIERADSLAFDFHKWMQVPYDAGFLLCRDGAWQRETFAADSDYLSRAAGGLAGGDWWPCDVGPDLSRGFRALKTWFTLTTYGLDRLCAMIGQTCALAARLAARVTAEPRLDLAAPVGLNVVCFRPAGDADGALSARIVETLHAEGALAPSVTRLDGRPAIRAAIVNHRTTAADIDRLVADVLRLEGALG